MMRGLDHLKGCLSKWAQLVELSPLLVSELRDARTGLVSAVESLRFYVDALRQERFEAERTYVYVLPPTGPMHAQSVAMRPGHSISVVFTPLQPIERGAWIVAVGPASVSGVRVGNQLQSWSFDGGGQVCQLANDAEPGVHVVVTLCNGAPS